MRENLNNGEWDLPPPGGGSDDPYRRNAGGEFDVAHKRSGVPFADEFAALEGDVREWTTREAFEAVNRCDEFLDAVIDSTIPPWLAARWDIALPLTPTQRQNMSHWIRSRLSTIGLLVELRDMINSTSDELDIMDLQSFAGDCDRLYEDLHQDLGRS